MLTDWCYFYDMFTFDFSLHEYLNSYTAVNLYETLKTVKSVQLPVFCFVDFALGDT